MDGALEAIQKTATHAPGVLKYDAEPNSSWLTGLDSERLHLETLHDQHGIDTYMQRWTSVATADTNNTSEASTGTADIGGQSTGAPGNQSTLLGTGAAARNPTTNRATNSNTTPPANGPNTASTSATAQPTVETVLEGKSEEADPEQEEELLFDPNEIIQDILLEEPNTHLHAHDTYLCEKQQLLGTKVCISNSSGKTAGWTVWNDVKKTEVAKEKEFSKVGVRDFDFNNQNITCGTRNSNWRINFLELLIKLLPGD